MALIAAAGELAIELKILPWPLGTAIEDVRKCFDAWRAARGDDDAIGHDDARAIEQVRLFLERYGPSKFESAGAGRPTIELAGWRRQLGQRVEYLIQPEYFKAEVCKGFEPTAVASALLDRDFLRRQGRAWTITTTVPGGKAKRRVYCVLESILMGHTKADDE